MGPDHPACRFSVVITSYNQREFISDAVNSALSLSFAGREIIVVDDGSSDGSQDLLAAYRDAIRFVRLESNGGKGAARNAGAAIATGRYLVFLDGDDVFLPWALDIYDRVAHAKKPKLILSSMLWFTGLLPAAHAMATPRAIRAVEYEDYFKKDRPFCVSASSVVIDRDAFHDVHGWATERFVMQDQDLVLRLGASGTAVQVLSPPTTLHRAHAGQTINQVRPFIDVIYEFIRNERLGHYPGGRRRRSERMALLGGITFFWVRRGIKARLYWDAVKLLAHGWALVAMATIRRLAVIIRGRRPCELIDV
jgi:glycosyltransferase involved in cell wall biosynthesis